MCKWGAVLYFACRWTTLACLVTGLTFVDTPGSEEVTRSVCFTTSSESDILASRL
ncbi:hypothetical protein OE88DRAFT_1659765 [Heliocybe sulcata]|uniref:Uncharacterized protein n=1 Tax=Heliocybe sulcata TaxID=5364 RepID=A0A5C3N108_9AGAM|nr:hypothetical protein OE88DRAFT_1659765 [Heliocybe sulcata]